MADTARVNCDLALSHSNRRRRRWLLVAALALALLTSAWGWHWWTTPEPPQIELHGAHRAVVEAVEAACAAVRRSPRSGQAWGELGMVLFANGCSADANICFAQAEQLDPESPTWIYLRATAELVVDREAALLLVRRAVARANPALPETRTMRLVLAEVLFEKGEHVEAVALCREVLAQVPDHPRARFDLGLIALADDDPRRCIDNLTPCIDSPYAAKRARVQLATAYRRLGDAAAAGAFVRSAAEMPEDRDWPDPIVLRAKGYAVGPQHHLLQVQEHAAMGRGREQLLSLRELAEEAGDGVAHWRLGAALAAAGDFDAAEPVLRTALHQSPGLASAEIALGVVLMRQGDRMRKLDDGGAQDKFRAAATLLRHAAAVRPAHGLNHLYLGQCLQRLGQLAEARTELRTAIQRQPDQAESHLCLGEILAEAGERDEASKHLQQAQSLAPTDPRPRDALARLQNGGKITPMAHRD